MKRESQFVWYRRSGCPSSVRYRCACMYVVVKQVHSAGISSSRAKWDFWPELALLTKTPFCMNWMGQLCSKEGPGATPLS